MPTNLRTRGFLKSTIRKAVKELTPSTMPPVLVASMGRSGSTVIYDSLIEGMAKKRLGGLLASHPGFTRDVAWRLDTPEFRNGIVYKTHDLPSERLSEVPNLRTVFLFGSASDAARSVIKCMDSRGPGWIKEHLEHLNALGEFDEIPHRDVLRFKQQIEDWMSFQSAPLLCLKYEDLWTSGAEEALSNFTGLPVSLPPKKERASQQKLNPETEALINKTYSEIDELVARLPSISMNRKAEQILQT